MRRAVRPLFVLFATAALAGPALALDKLHYQYSWIPTGEYGPVSAGIEKGFFREVGIDLTYTTGRGSGDAVKKVAGGAAMVGDGDISTVMAARVREKAPMRCIAAQHTYSPHSLFVLESSGIQDFKSLAGKTLATTPGNSHFIYFPLVAKLTGLDPNSVKWITTDAPAMGPMLIAGKVDGAPMFATHATFQNRQAEKQGKKIKVIPFSDYGFRIYSYCWFATEDTIKAHPDLLRRFLAALQKSFIWSKDNVAEAARLHNKRHPEITVQDSEDYIAAVLKFMFNETSAKTGLGYFDREQLANTYKAVAMSQDLDPAQDPAQFIDESLLPPKK
ncbi:MAG: ABC transporter substrate-binding protein [Alphaproteobacteria bacterium]|nr:ABC transporter substrate-binding protein [Alphaproteobacteria bacterium]